MEKMGYNKCHFATLCDNVRQKTSTLNKCLLAVCGICNYLSVNLLLANTERGEDVGEDVVRGYSTCYCAYFVEAMA